jgi:hypothetical protein
VYSDFTTTYEDKSTIFNQYVVFSSTIVIDGEHIFNYIKENIPKPNWTETDPNSIIELIRSEIDTKLDEVVGTTAFSSVTKAATVEIQRSANSHFAGQSRGHV